MSGPPYRVVIDAREWERFEKSAPPGVLREARRIRDTFLAYTPEDRVAAGGKLKKLRGKLEGYLQYDLPQFYRLWYRVDRDSRVVYVEYVGPHPE